MSSVYSWSLTNYKKVTELFKSWILQWLLHFQGELETSQSAFSSAFLSRWHSDRCVDTVDSVDTYSAWKGSRCQHNCYKLVYLWRKASVTPPFPGWIRNQPISVQYFQWKSSISVVSRWHSDRCVDTVDTVDTYSAWKGSRCQHNCYKLVYLWGKASVTNWNLSNLLSLPSKLNHYIKFRIRSKRAKEVPGWPTRDG